MLLLVVSGAQAQGIDPSALQNRIIRDAIERSNAQRRNDMMRLELERLDLEAQLRYRRMSDREVWAELDRHCQNGEQPCRRQPPQVLLQEAARRGLIEFTHSAQPPRTQCSGIADPGGAISIDCY